MVAKAGQIRAFAADGDGSDASTVLDLSSVVGTDGRLLGASLPAGRWRAAIASYLPSGAVQIVISRFAVDAQGKASLASQEELLPPVPITDATRAGGALAFLFDGTLVVAFGDGGEQQRRPPTNLLAGKALRIDVERPSSRLHACPPTIPFVERWRPRCPRSTRSTSARPRRAASIASRPPVVRRSRRRHATITSCS